MPVYLELVTLIGWNVPNYQGVFLLGYGGQTSYHYGAVGHWSAGLARRTTRGWNTRNMGRAFLSTPKPRWRSRTVRFTGLLERRA